VKIIQAYRRVGTEATLADVARLVVMNETTVRGNNGFLLSIGVIQGGKKAITALGADLAHALEHEESLPEEAASKWRAVVEIASRRSGPRSPCQISCDYPSNQVGPPLSTQT